MSSSKKYPKAFYDDGLGDILEWIDDEVLVNIDRSKSEVKKKSRKAPESKNAIRLDFKKSSKESRSKPKIYGDNELSDLQTKSNKKIKFELDCDDEVEPDKMLEDRTRGLINRLAAQTMPFVTSEFEKLYSTNSRSSVSMSIFRNVEMSVLNPHAITKRKLVAELMLLVSYLDSKISHAIGASLVHRLVVKFEDLYNNGTSDDDKTLDNIVFCLMNLYVTGLIGSKVVFQLTNRICRSEDFRPKSVELLLIVFRSIGFQLRKDSPSLMRQLIVMVTENSKQLKENTEVSSRIQCMIDALGAIKNNNISKIGNYGCDIDRDAIESTLKSLVQRTRLAETLSDATYEEILHSANWYLMETRVDEASEPEAGANTQAVEISSKKELKICKALGLNKPTERTIFSALLKVSDYVEASNIIIGFGLNYCSDAMLVCVHVAIHEKKHNPFYFNLINNLCKFNRRYKMATKFTIQDKIRILNEMTPQRVDVFGRLCFELIKSDAIPITILKSIEWANLNESTKKYLTFMIESISDLADEDRRKVMIKVDKKSSFAGALRTFTNCFLKNCKLFS